jgi:hypothetical protein
VSRRYRFGPIERRAVFGPLDAPQAVTLGGGAILAMGVFLALGDAAGLGIGAVILALSVAAISAPIEGRTAHEWAPAAIGWTWRRVTGNDRYRSRAPRSGTRVGADGESTHDLSLPAELSGLELLPVPYGDAEVGVMRDRKAGTYTVAMAVRGGAFILRDAAEQERALDAWGDVLASTARDGSPVRRIQWIEQTLPEADDEMHAYFESHRDRDIPEDSDHHRSYVELLNGAASAPSSTGHGSFFGVQISERLGAREIRRLGGGVEAACRLAVREAESLAERCDLAGLEVAGLLRPRQYAAHVRDAYDPFGRAGRDRLAVADPSREGVEPELMGPMAAEESWSRYRTDSAWHTTWWISSWPRSDVGPMFMVPLLMGSGSMRTVSVTIEPVPYSQAMRKAEAAQTAEVAEELQRGRQGYVSTARVRRRAEAVSRREEELADGHAAVRFVGMMRIDRASDEDLERGIGPAEHAAALARLGLRRCYGEQASAFVDTLLLARGLD